MGDSLCMDSKATQQIPNFTISGQIARAIVAAFRVLSDDKGAAPVAPIPCDSQAVTQPIPVFS